MLKHAASVHALAVTPDQSLVVTGDQQGVVHVWDRTSAKELWSNRLEADGEVTGVAVSPDGLAGLAVVSTAGGNTKTVCGWEPLPDAAGLSVFLTFDDRDVWSAIFAPTGSRS